MRKTMTWAMACVVATLACGAAWGAPVGQEVAQRVAEEGVETVFPGEGWVPADAVAVRDGEGGVAAWGFVFALEGSAYAEEGAVRVAVADGEAGDDGESELYVSTATIVTGANDTDSLVFRHFRGLADWYQEGTLDGWRGEAVRLGAGDIRYGAGAPAGARGPGKAAALKKAAAARKAAVAAERDALPEYLQKAADEADADAAAAAKARWGAAEAQVRQTQRKAAVRAAE
ncbi:MAG: hypothetical protein IJT88_09670 [Kiritimatiellae bacterium]|nr:hypothetical protein [Kiritimatiellia bacterium]